MRRYGRIWVCWKGKGKGTGKGIDIERRKGDGSGEEDRSYSCGCSMSGEENTHHDLHCTIIETWRLSLHSLLKTSTSEASPLSQSKYTSKPKKRTAASNFPLPPSPFPKTTSHTKQERKTKNPPELLD